MIYTADTSKTPTHTSKHRYTEMEDGHPTPHAIMIPAPLQGHIIPFVHLAIKLASRGFTITFVNTQIIHQQISEAQPHRSGDDIFAAARNPDLDIRYTTVSDGLPIGFDRSLNQDQYLECLIHVFSAHVDELVGKIVHSDPPATCLIADSFYVWPSMISKKYNLVNVSFWTEPALVLNLYHHLDLLRKNGHFGTNDNREDTIDYIPGVKAIEPTDLVSYMQDTDISTAEHRLVFKALEDVKNADFIVCNTVQELEAETISALHQKQPIYAIGPIFPPGFAKSSVATSLWLESDCTQWLNTKLQGSVLYISLGSLASPTKHDIAEMAHGLLISEVNFVWVLRPGITGPNDSDILPVGFKDGVKDRGLVVPWCCQIAAITHPAIGGFLTHCGWNSILESIWANVPLICFPLHTDQFTNRKLVVDDWKIGINLCDRKLLARQEVAKKINRFMSGQTLDELRMEIKKLRNALENALTSDGSSERNFDQFIKDVKVKIHGVTNRNGDPVVNLAYQPS